MKKQLEIHTITRSNIVKAIEDLTEEQLNIIPEGFKNSIIWNVAHVLVTQQLLCYKFSGLEMELDESFIDLFKKGSEADYEVDQEEVILIKEQLMVLAAKLEEDYQTGIFKNYKSYLTSYNVIINNIEDAITFNNIHEGLHLGYIMGMKKRV